MTVVKYVPMGSENFPKKKKAQNCGASVGQVKHINKKKKKFFN